MQDSQHIIHKLTLEVNTSSVEQGYEIKDNVRSFIDTHVVPAIEQYFAGLTSSMSADEVLQLDKLELTINGGQGGWNISGLSREIQQEFEKAVSVTRSELMAVSPKRKTPETVTDSLFSSVSTTLNEAPKVENLQVFTKSMHGVLAWISFLNDGTTSWFTEEMQKAGSGEQEQQLLKAISESVDMLLKKREQVFASENARQRLIRQFSDSFLVSLVTVAGRNALSFSYSTVIPSQQPIAVLVRELLRGASSEVRIRFWEVVFGMLRLDTNNVVLSEEVFLVELERLFPQAIQRLTAEGSVGKKKRYSKSAGKKITESEIGSVSTSSDSESHLMLNDVSIVGIRVLEWLHVLQSKPVSMKEYVRLQTVVLKKRPDATGAVNTKIADATESTELLRTEKLASRHIDDNAVQASETADQSGEVKQLDPGKKTVANTEEAENQLEEIEPGQAEQSLKNSDELSSDSKEQPEQSAEKAETVSNAKTTEKGHLEEAASNEKGQLHDTNHQLSEESAVQSKQGADPVLEPVDKTASPNTPVSSPETTKSGKPDKRKESDQPSKKSFKDEHAHLLVENAGLVIIHPFLKHFFAGIGLLDAENKLTDKVLAAHALHYVATGREHDFEQAMSFEKYLVGIDPFESIPREVVLSDAIKQESENLLNAVRSNWKPLESSSTEALRETFLQRHGKLINESPNPRLVVERKTVDVLLNQLNWTISIVRLPWLDELIFVEW